MSDPKAYRLNAILMLLLANLFWALSFVLIKSVAFEHMKLLPSSGSWFVAVCSLWPRFWLATVIVGGWIFLRRMRGADGGGSIVTRNELRQGLWLAFFASGGMLLQNDGLQYTKASTSAFLTQLYAILIPLYVALVRRRMPSVLVWISVVLVLAGGAVLAQLDWRDLRLGRGEIETLLSSVFFTGQILMLDRGEYAGNRALPVTLVLFAAEAVFFTVMGLGLAERASDMLVLWTSMPWVVFTLGLTVFCTVGAFLIMNIYQPRITTTEAGLIYCVEPLFTAVMALFLPAIFSVWAGFAYQNETLTSHLLLGGGLITLANVLIQMRPPVKE